MKKSWWTSVLEVTKRERAGLISLCILLGLLGGITHRYRHHEQQAAVRWSVQHLPNAPQPVYNAGNSDKTQARTWKKQAGPWYQQPKGERKEPYASRYPPRKQQHGASSPESLAQSRRWENWNGNGKSRFRAAPRVIDVNQADSLDWLQLPGIGPTYARRILRFRAKLGGFFELGQVRETFGLPDSTYELIQPYLQLQERPQPWLELNKADQEALSAHPYISQALARHIIAYRQQHGAFQEAGDLKQVRLVNDSVWRKISPYIIIN